MECKATSGPVNDGDGSGFANKRKTSKVAFGSICHFGCVAGYYIADRQERTWSRSCTDGAFNGKEITCAPCLAGTFKTSSDPAAGPDNRTCDKCPANTDTGSSTGASSCRAAAGYFGSGSNIDVCAANTYKATANNPKACDDCPTNSGTGGESGIKAENGCLADAGFTGSGSNVEVCAANTYKATAASAKACNDCPTNSGGESGVKAERECLADAGYFGRGRSVAACPTDTFKTAPGATGCTGCPAKSNTGGATGSTVASACVAAEEVVTPSAGATNSAAATSDGNTSDSTVVIITVMVVLMCCAIFVVAIVYNNEDKNKDQVAPTSQADRETLKNAFDLFDTDNTGELNKEEFRLAMSAGDEDSAFSNADFEKLFARVDSDGSGVISFDEYYRWSVE